MSTKETTVQKQKAEVGAKVRKIRSDIPGEEADLIDKAEVSASIKPDKAGLETESSGLASEVGNQEPGAGNLNGPTEVDIESIIIDKEFQNLIAQPTDDEFSILKTSLQTDRQLAPVIVWATSGRLILLDGHNRHQILKTLGQSKIIVHELKFPEREAAEEWILKNQLGRRNLKPRAMSLLRGKLFNLRKNPQGGDRRSKGQSGILNDTAEQVAQESGVSARTIKRDGQLAAAAAKLNLEPAILDGTCKLSNRAIIEQASHGDGNPKSSTKEGKEATSSGSRDKLDEDVEKIVKAIGRICWSELSEARAQALRMKILAAFPKEVFSRSDVGVPRVRKQTCDQQEICDGWINGEQVTIDIL